MSDDFPIGGILTHGISPNYEADRLLRDAQADALKPDSDEAKYLKAEHVDIDRPLLDQPVEKVETYRP